jgi:putative endonuclease
MTMQRQALGIRGENLAVDELERRGYAILARRYRTRHGEIDIVARDGETIVFVEVKAKDTAEFGSAAEAVGARKQRRIVSMAVDYLARHRLTAKPCRFDVVAIDGSALTYYKGAFAAE